MTEQNKQPVSLDEAITAFKAEFVTEGSIVLDAWAEGEFIQVYVDAMRMTDEDMNPSPELAKIPAPGEYKGHPTMLTLFPQDDDVDTIVFEED